MEVLPVMWCKIGVGMMIPYIENGEYHCSNCDTEVERDWVFCQECGECIEWDEVSDEKA